MRDSSYTRIVPESTCNQSTLYTRESQQFFWGFFKIPAPLCYYKLKKIDVENKVT